MTKKGRAFKNRVRSELALQWAQEQQPDPNDPHMLVLRFYLPSIYNATYGKKRGAKTKFKRIDLSGLIKITEDVIVDVTGADDATHLSLVLMKKQDPKNPGVEVEIWRVNDELFVL